MKLTFMQLQWIKVEDFIHLGFFTFYSFLYVEIILCTIYSCDGTIKLVENPLDSVKHSVILQHENEIEALFIDENFIFYCGNAMNLLKVTFLFNTILFCLYAERKR